MRHKKGSKVEVLSKNEVPSGSWRCAEIICGNGNDYTVRYDMHPGATDEAVVERVSRKSVRPFPPLVKLSENWISGDVVEVFQNFSWKMATVSMVFGRNYFLVRLLGSSQEFKVSKFDLRVRQSWQDNKWIVIGKGSGNCEDKKCNERSTLTYNKHSNFQVKQTDTRVNFCVKDDLFEAKNYVNFPDSHIVSSRTLKRGSPYGYSQIEVHAGMSRKFRVVEKDGSRYCMPAHPYLSPEKVDTIASLQELPGEKHMYVSYNNKTTRFPEMDERKKSNNAVGCSRAVSLEPNVADSVTCSVGSCSITSNNFFKLPSCFYTGPVEDTDDHFSDAESVCQWGHDEGDCSLPTKEELAAEIHRLELHAYRCTIEALHASGPLSWEQETMGQSRRLVHLASRSLKDDAGVCHLSLGVDNG
ncbi:uncharacterized protein LOC132279970 isoform X2 [Cornus florida]|uniref:uncharacterized protein LOC132279970 isoform X2 n=1 Tax=Cornus florida TaxID=4283 RepID=UPI0028985AFB|nr:uncharacterized protein LOC132279970 isoform X2 [Cornus florida]